VDTEPSALLLELGAIVFALAIASRLARRVGIPAIPLYLLAGLAFGEGGLADLGAATGFIEAGAEIGIILMLLMLGLEYSSVELRTNLQRSAPSGLLDLVLNFPPGLLTGLVLGWDLLSAVLLGGATYISSSGVVAKLLADLERVGNRETPVVLTILVIEDLAMAIYLPVVAGVLFGGPAMATVLTVIGALIAVVAILYIAQHYGESLSRLAFSQSSETLLLTLLGITLVVAGLAERIQLSAAVGAFLVGIVLSGEAASEARGVLLPLRNLFAAVFFVFFGLEVDPGLIPGVALTAGLLAATTAGTKIVTGWVAAGQKGIGPRGRLRTGTALVARGEFSIVIGALGVQREADLGAFVAAYVLFLAIAGPILARYSDSLVRR